MLHESYRRRFGCYPESVHVDQIYRTRQPCVLQRARHSHEWSSIGSSTERGVARNEAASTRRRSHPQHDRRQVRPSQTAFWLGACDGQVVHDVRRSNQPEFSRHESRSCAPSASFCASRFAHTPAATRVRSPVIAGSPTATVPAASPYSAPLPFRLTQKYHTLPNGLNQQALNN